MLHVATGYSYSQCDHLQPLKQQFYSIWHCFINMCDSETCQVGYGFAHGLTKFVYTQFWEASTVVQTKAIIQYCTLGYEN